MAFFGLTALGPQNSFADNLKDAVLVDIFSDADFLSAFRAVAVDGKLKGTEELSQVCDSALGP